MKRIHLRQIGSTKLNKQKKENSPHVTYSFDIHATATCNQIVFLFFNWLIILFNFFLRFSVVNMMCEKSVFPMKLLIRPMYSI